MRDRTVARVVVLLSQVAGPGGVQRYNRLFCKSLAEYKNQRNISLDVVSLHDPLNWRDESSLDQALTGCGGSRPLFVVRALRSLLRPYSLVVVGQVDLGPVALFPHLIWRDAVMLSLVHGIEVWSRLPWLKRAGLRRADRVWAVSSYTKQRLVQAQGVQPGRVQVVPNVLDPDFAQQVGVSVAGSPDRSRLVTVSRLARSASEKGVDELILALPTIRVTVPDVNLTVVGDGDDLPRLRQLARERGVGDIVTFSGRVSDADLHRYLDGADVFVLPSRQEGFGIVFLEAMAHGRAVVAGAHGGTPEVVLDGITGHLVPYGDSDALVAAVVSLLTDPLRRDAMGAAGAARVRDVFVYDRFRDAMFLTLDDLLSRAGRPNTS